MHSNGVYHRDLKVHFSSVKIYVLLSPKIFSWTDHSNVIILLFFKAFFFFEKIFILFTFLVKIADFGFAGIASSADMLMFSEVGTTAYVLHFLLVLYFMTII